jgi:hypothetical protein
MDRFTKAAFAAPAAAALLVAQPAQAAMGCWDQPQAAAAKVRDFQSRLMVAALRCRAMGFDVLAAYNDFVRRNRGALQTENGLIHAQFETGYGKAADTYYDRFATGLANRYGGDATNAEICDEAASAAEEGAAAAGDVARLVALADRFGAAPDLPGGACAAAASTWAVQKPAAAAVTFTAAMDEALTDASDAPAAPEDPSSAGPH